MCIEISARYKRPVSLQAAYIVYKSVYGIFIKFAASVPYSYMGMNMGVKTEWAANHYNRSVNSRGASLLFGVWGVCVRLLLKISAELRFCEECLP